MAEEGDSGEKTEDPTSRRLSKSREDGNVGQSRDLNQLLSITAGFFALQFMAPYLWRDLTIVFTGAFSSSLSSEPFTIGVLRSNFLALIMLVLPDLLIITLAAAIAGALSSAIQTKFLWTMKPLKPKMSHLHPIKGLKRPFTAPGLMNTGKSIAKLAIICPIAYFAYLDLFPRILGLMSASFGDLLPFTALAMNYIFWKIFSVLIVLAIADLIWQKWHTKTKLKMSKVEVKEERKAVEGDEATKRRIIAMGLSRARDRMMQAVPHADVVVTNPTHFAVALTYSMKPGEAPKVVAKGRGFVALRIREIATKSGVPIVERKSLARALFKAVEVGQEIPYQLYQAVAELLAYVYRITGKNPLQKQGKVSN